MCVIWWCNHETDIQKHETCYVDLNSHMSSKINIHIIIHCPKTITGDVNRSLRKMFKI